MNTYQIKARQADFVVAELKDGELVVEHGPFERRNQAVACRDLLLSCDALASETLRNVDRALTRVLAAQHKISRLTDDAPWSAVRAARADLVNEVAGFNARWLGALPVSFPERLAATFGEHAGETEVRWVRPPVFLAGAPLRGWLFDKISAAEARERAPALAI